MAIRGSILLCIFRLKLLSGLRDSSAFGQTVQISFAKVSLKETKRNSDLGSSENYDGAAACAGSGWPEWAFTARIYPRTTT